MLNQLATAMAGFAFIALILLFIQKRTEPPIASLLAKALLSTLLSIQLFQLLYITDYLSFNKTTTALYLLLLALVGPIFYLYSQYIIQSNKQWTSREYGHFIPVILIALGSFLSISSFQLNYSLAFILGGIYMAKLAWALYQLRIRRSLFRMEFILTSLFLLWSIAVVVLGIFSTQSITILIPVQTIMLTLAIAAAVHIQLNYPHLLSSLEELAQRQYQASTLLNIDCDKIKQQLTHLMLDEQLYQDCDLSLSSLADHLDLKAHQLSELLNTQLGMSFSSYLREQRIKSAEKLLQDEPKVSVLAVGLNVGFSSQSAFYSAFKTVHGIAPGQYRKNILT